MADLGEWGRARAIEREPLQPDTFGFYGQRFVIPAGISVVVLMDFVADQQTAQDDREAATAAREKADAAVDAARTPEGRAAAQEAADEAAITVARASNRMLTAMRDYCRGCLGDQWDAFNDACRINAVDIEELMDVCARIYSVVSARPTTWPSGSSGGPSSTGDGSTGGSVSPVPTTGGDVILGEVLLAQGTPADQQREQFKAHMVPVGAALTPSGG